VEVNVHKGDVQGFSKLELTLPDGFVATPGEIKGASFTFSGDKAKFVWMNLPEDQTFTITYYIESEQGIEGAYEIKGTFSYVKENKREDIYVPTRTVVVKEQAATPAEVVAAASPVSGVVRIEAPVLEMTCERRIERLADNEYLVKLKVNNNKIVGFGKILEVLPDNCSTNRENDGGAVITQDANSIKFVWFEVPVAPTFEVSYRVMCISDGAVPIIRGQVSYTENGNPFTVDVVQMEAPADMANSAVANNTGAAVDSTSSNSTDTNTASNSTSDTTSNSSNTTTTGGADGNNVNASNTASTETSSGANTNANSSSTAGSADATNATQTAGGDTQVANVNQSQGNANSSTQNSADAAGNGQERNRKNGSKTNRNDVKTESSNTLSAEADRSRVSVKSVPSAEKGITYKVQILAAHRVVDKSYLKKTFSFEEDYNIEHHNGWIKYTTGSYAQYKDARDARVKITNESNKLPGPFVTAYNDGERITVQEALLISKQLWYK